MANKRLKLPRSIEAEILFINDRTCCICKDPSKSVAIHHIDGNRNNNKLENLAIVCIQHHDEIHRTSGMTKGIPPGLVKKYKRSWELAVRRKRLNPIKPLQTPTGFEKVLFAFEIRKIIYQFLAKKSSDTNSISELFEYLLSIYLFEGYKTQILKSLDQAAVMTALSTKTKASMLAKHIYEYFVSLVGPKEVAMGKRDVGDLKTAIEILRAIGTFSAEFNKSISVLRSCSESLQNFFDIALWYDRELIAIDIIKSFNEISDTCTVVYEREKPLVQGVSEIKKTKKILRDKVVEERPKWKKILRYM